MPLACKLEIYLFCVLKQFENIRAMVSLKVKKWLAIRLSELVKIPAAKPDDLNLITGIYMLGRKNQSLQVLFWPPYML